MEVEHNKYPRGSEYFVLLFAYDCPKSLELYPKWNKISRIFDNVTNLDFGHCDLTSSYFEGTWRYWTPLIRYYKMDKSFDYYYDDLKIKTIENYLNNKSMAYKWWKNSDNYKYKAPVDKYFVYQNYCSNYFLE